MFETFIFRKIYGALQVVKKNKTKIDKLLMMDFLVVVVVVARKKEEEPKKKNSPTKSSHAMTIYFDKVVSKE